MNTQTSNTTKGQRDAAARLVTLLLSKDMLISVHDGEEFTVKRSDKKTTILEALGTTEEDVLHVRRKSDKEKCGMFVLVWGNSSDGSDLISDMSDNAFCDEISEKLAEHYN